jgi:phosphoglycolate phosphatase-like HAD superfamily hydrolase
VRTAISQVANGARPEEVLVIGDTPHDVSSALDNGVIAVGVATGSFSEDDLRQSGAQMVFADFSDWQKSAEQLLRGP